MPPDPVRVEVDRSDSENGYHKQVSAEDDNLMLQLLRDHARDENETAAPLAAVQQSASSSSVVPGGCVGLAPKIHSLRTETGKFRTRLYPFANDIAFGAGADRDGRVKEIAVQQLAVASGTQFETKIVESHWEVFCEIRGREPWSPIPSGHELRCFVQELAGVRRANGESLYKYNTLKKRLNALRVCIERRDRNAWAARDAVTDAYLQRLQSTHVGLNRCVLCLPIDIEENRVLVKTALAFTPNMSLTVRMTRLRGALLQALLQNSGVRPSSAGVASGYAHRQDPNFPSVADLMTTGEDDEEGDDKDNEGGKIVPPIGGLVVACPGHQVCHRRKLGILAVVTWTSPFSRATPFLMLPPFGSLGWAGSWSRRRRSEHSSLFSLPHAEREATGTPTNDEFVEALRKALPVGRVENLSILRHVVCPQNTRWDGFFMHASNTFARKIKKRPPTFAQIITAELAAGVLSEEEFELRDLERGPGKELARLPEGVSMKGKEKAPEEETDKTNEGKEMKEEEYAGGYPRNIVTGEWRAVTFDRSADWAPKYHKYTRRSEEEIAADPKVAPKPMVSKAEDVKAKEEAFVALSCAEEFDALNIYQKKSSASLCTLHLLGAAS
ncbi:hypothetical protein HDU86_005546 [Geranomyces michiganensis]|nr:hypothetical protein HDU86_005546 [Geranomyces michiganensis]